MQYIVLDMEWNQPWPGSPSAKKVLPSPIRGEIVQIGAVRMPRDGEVADEFQTLIRPAYYKKMNRKVASLTGIKDSVLKERGKPFREAMQAFHDWCGEDAAFLTWGFDDIVILKENLTLYGMDTAWVDTWYNAQLIFNAQTDGSSAQKSLSSAMQIMGIEPTRPAHDALGDAYHTALICSRLNLTDGIAAYEKAAKEHENGFHGAELPGCLLRSVSHGHPDKPHALAAMAGSGNICPVCGKHTLTISRGIEVGNIFQLGSKYTRAMHMQYTDAEGVSHYPVMGCYGIGVGRLAASVCEARHDGSGPIWPVTIAPWQVHLCCMRSDNRKVRETADKLYDGLQKAGIEVLYDDRNVSAGIMFSDADLLGIPVRLIMSPRNLKENCVEMTLRRDKTDTGRYSMEEIIPRVEEKINELMAELQPES